LTGRGPRDTAYVLTIASIISILTTLATCKILGPQSIHTSLAVLLILPAIFLLIDSILAILGKDTLQIKAARALLFYIGWKDQGASKVPALTTLSQNLIGRKARRYLNSQNLTPAENETFYTLIHQWEKSLASLVILCKNLNKETNKKLIN
jgi:hypothetical protein